MWLSLYSNILYFLIPISSLDSPFTVIVGVKLDRSLAFVVGSASVIGISSLFRIRPDPESVDLGRSMCEIVLLRSLIVPKVSFDLIEVPT